MGDLVAERMFTLIPPPPSPLFVICYLGKTPRKQKNKQTIFGTNLSKKMGKKWVISTPLFTSKAYF